MTVQRRLLSLVGAAALASAGALALAVRWAKEVAPVRAVPAQVHSNPRECGLLAT